MLAKRINPSLNVSNIVESFAWFEKLGCDLSTLFGDGIEVAWPPTDAPWNIQEMHVRHPDGHVFRRSQERKGS